METAYENLSKSELIALAEEQAFEIEKLKIELDQCKRLIYGAKSERFVPQAHPEQTMLELGLEFAPEPAGTTERVSYTRRKPKKRSTPHGRKPFPAHLQRIEHVIEPDEDVTGLKKIGSEVTEALEYVPPTYHVIRFIRPKYAKPKDEGVLIAALPFRPVERGSFGPGFLAHLILSKCVDHLPLYRQRQQFARQGVELALSTLADNFAAGVNALAPLFDLHRRRVLSGDYLQVDESPIQVLDRSIKRRSHRGQMWVYHDPLGRQVLFDYRIGRGREGPADMLQNYAGALQTDGYSVYDEFGKRPGIIALACMAHARRYFEKALDSDPARAQYALLEIQKLYAIEHEAREAGLSFAARHGLRYQKARPLLDAFESWMKQQLVAPDFRPKSQIGTAVGYALKRWPELCRYLDDGRYEIDNNLVENAIRPLALGRKNYLFAGSHNGAMRLAVVYSLAATAKLHGIDPFAWLRDVLTRIAGHPYNQLADLLPINWQPPEAQVD